MAGIETLKKLTMKAIEAQPSLDDLAKLEKQGKGASIDVADIFGIAMKFKPGESAHGAYIRFAGRFKATNLRTKKVYESGAFLAPKMIEESLWAVMKAEEVNEVQFAFRIGVKFDPAAATKYVYTATALTKPAENDPLAMLEKQVHTALLEHKK